MERISVRVGWPRSYLSSRDSPLKGQSAEIFFIQGLFHGSTLYGALVFTLKVYWTRILKNVYSQDRNLVTRICRKQATRARADNPSPLAFKEKAIEEKQQWCTPTGGASCVRDVLLQRPACHRVRTLCILYKLYIVERSSVNDAVATGLFLCLEHVSISGK